MQYTESIPASLLRQFIFCPRIPYYNVLLNISEKKPIWMDQGLKFHNRLQLLLQRRSFKRFGLSNAQVSYNTSLYSKSFNLHGFADCLLLSENEVVPLEFKIEGNKLRKAHILQLLAYGYMAQEQFQKKFVKGFIIYGEKSNAVYQIGFFSDIFSSTL